MIAYTYMLINFLTIIICFIFSFHPKIKFNQLFLPFITASILVAIPFIIWDAFFTKMGVWWFNNRYLISIRCFGLPIEELLFFICIPFSCTFTYYCIDRYYPMTFLKKHNNKTALIFIILSVITTMFYWENIYTKVTFALLGLSIIILQYILKINWLTKALVVYICLLPGFFMVNGVLTGTGLESPIVNYNSKDFANIRLWTIPIEDAFYGFMMILWNLYFFTIFKNKFKRKRNIPS